METKTALIAGLMLFACPAAFAAGHHPAVPAFKVVPMIADKAGKAPVVDPQLKNFAVPGWEPVGFG
jgi:hypothetical protein